MTFGRWLFCYFFRVEKNIWFEIFMKCFDKISLKYLTKIDIFRTFLTIVQVTVGKWVWWQVSIAAVTLCQTLQQNHQQCTAVIIVIVITVTAIILIIVMSLSSLPSLPSLSSSPSSSLEDTVTKHQHQHESIIVIIFIDIIIILSLSHSESDISNV